MSKILVVFFCLVCTSGALSQQAPTFFLKVPNDNRPPNGRLSFYLDYLAHRYVSRHLRSCTPSSMGIFRFVVTKRATIDSVFFSGSMSVDMADEWKKAIKTSAVGWQPATRDGKPIDTPVTFCFFYENQITQEHCPNYPKDGRMPTFSLYSDLLFDLFKDGQELIPTKGGYMIRPNIVVSMQ